MEKDFLERKGESRCIGALLSVVIDSPFISQVILSFDKYLMGIYCAPGTRLSAEQR